MPQEAPLLSISDGMHECLLLALGDLPRSVHSGIAKMPPMAASPEANTALPDVSFVDIRLSLGGRRGTILSSTGALLAGSLLVVLLIGGPFRWGTTTPLAGGTVCVGLAVAALIGMSSTSERARSRVMNGVVLLAPGVAAFLMGVAVVTAADGVIMADAETGVLSSETVRASMAALLAMGALVGFIAAFSANLMLAKILRDSLDSAGGVWWPRCAVAAGGAVVVFGVCAAMYFFWLTIATTGGFG